MNIIREADYLLDMQNVVEPYLEKRREEKYIEAAKERPDAERHIRTRIHLLCYRADEAKGIVVIGHGFTEAAVKYEEMIYYFLQAGYHVYAPDHCGHGWSYRLTEDKSLVHLDSWKRYVRDFLRVCQYAQKQHPDLPLNLFAHSMGGAIGAIAAAWRPEWFHRIILNSPMIRPLTDNVPWKLAIMISGSKCLIGQSAKYVVGQKPYDASDTYENSAMTSEPRFDRYNELRKVTEELQTCAASYGWLFQASHMNAYLETTAWKKYICPVMMIQGEHDAFVSVREIRKFADHIQKHGQTSCEYLYLPGTKHETYCSDDETMELYVNKVLDFLADA